MLKFEELAEDIYLLKTPFSSIWSGVYLVNGEEPVMIDAGSSAEIVDTVIMPALEDLGVAPSQIKWLINTHAHGDHSNGNLRLLELTGAKFAAFETAAHKFRDLLFYSVETRTKYPEHSPKPPTFIPNVEPELVLKEGDTLAGRLVLYSTPGHDSECISIFDKKTGSMLVGDTLQFDGTIDGGEREIGFYKDLKAYRSSIAKLRRLAPKNIFASHEYTPGCSCFFGPEESMHALDLCEQISDGYTKKVKELLASGVTDTAEIAIELVKTGPGKLPGYLFCCMFTADEHIREAKQ